jgi:hypothetical protein
MKLTHDELIALAKDKSISWITDIGEVKGGCKFTWSGYLELARTIESFTEQRLSEPKEAVRCNLREVEAVDSRLFVELARKVIMYYQGEGKYNFSHLPRYDRDNAAFDAWQEIRQEIKEALKKYDALKAAGASGNAGPRRYHVNMTYFKKSGKFYDEAWISVPGDMELHQIWELVRRMRSEGRLEGLVEGAGREFMILVNVPGHRHEHPHLIV